MAAPKRTEIQRERDLVEVARLYLRGETQQAITDELNRRYYTTAPLSRQAIGYDIKVLITRWRKTAFRDINERKAEELARIDALEREYWTAWENSLNQFESRIVKGKGRASAGGKPDTMEQTTRTEDRNGDPRYLQGVQWCISKRCEILGITGRSAATLNIDLNSLNDDQLRRIAAGEDPVHVLADGGAR